MRPPSRHILNAWMALSLILSVALVSGCGLLPAKKQSTESRLRALREPYQGTPEGVIPTELQSELMRYADRFSLQLNRSLDDLIPRLRTPEARAHAQGFKADQASAAVFIASGSEALPMLLDMIVLVDLGRPALEAHFASQEAERVKSVLANYTELEKDLWTLAGKHLRAEQIKELHELLEHWKQQHHQATSGPFIRFRDVVEAFDSAVPRKAQPTNSVTRLAELDPLAGLNVASRTAEEARFLADRAMYYVQRLPVVTQWRSEHLLYKLALAPELREAFALSGMLSNTTVQLPALLTQQREAAIHQVFAELAVQQSNLVTQLATHEQQFGGALTNMRVLMSTGTEAASAANGLVGSMRDLFRQLPTRELGMALTNSRPFDIREYAAAISEMTASAREFNLLMQSADRTFPKVMQQGVSSGEQFTNHIFKLAVVYGVLFMVALVAALLAYRFLARRFFQEQ
ncbi:MAG: hypothetical protein JWM16_1909 [Verrucomicrobiales bacterium]|nr:hypothetical protein [Verrucomicrobiales bacterium]